MWEDAGEKSWIASTSNTMKLVATMCRHSGQCKHILHGD